MPTDLQRLNYNKEKIISTIRARGPSLPVHIAKALKVDPLFASAFLGELRAEKQLEISNMKVGGSPLYYAQGQEPMLERFTEHLNQREKEALMLLKEKQVLEDETQNPVVRVALRAIKDFAIPIRARVNGELKLFWKYFTLQDEGVKGLLEQAIQIKQDQKPELEKKAEAQQVQEKIEQEVEKEIKKEIKHTKKQVSEKEAEIKEERVKEKTPVKKQKKVKKEREAFLNELKPILEKKNLELIHILEYDNKEVLARVKAVDKGNKELLLLAINKRKVDEKTIKKAYKKARPYNLPYTILALSSPPKSLKEKHEMYSNLISFEDLEQV